MTRWGSDMDLGRSTGDDAMSFGRQGYGAPVRDKTGTIS